MLTSCIVCNQPTEIIVGGAKNHYCSIACRKKRVKEYFKERYKDPKIKARKTAYQRAYEKRPEVRARKTAYQREYYKNNYKKYHKDRYKNKKEERRKEE